MSAADEDKKTKSPAQLIDARISELGDWRGESLARVLELVKKADPGVVEEGEWGGGGVRDLIKKADRDVVEGWKGRGVPVWEHEGQICTGESYKSFVKLPCAKGASLKDPKGLFNSSLDGNVRRAIDISEGEQIDEAAFTALIKEAVALNEASKR